MKPVDILILGIVLLTVGLAAFYIVRAKKKGQKCIGCPYAKKCGGHCKE